MSDTDGLLEVRIVEAGSTMAAIQALRAIPGLSLSEIRSAIGARTPLAVGSLWGNDRQEVEQRALALLRALDAAGARYEILLDGGTESLEYLHNALAAWRETGVETQRIAELESGSPSVETLEWLKREYPADAFRQTLRQIVAGEGYRVDPETRAWAARELGEAAG